MVTLEKFLAPGLKSNVIIVEGIATHWDKKKKKKKKHEEKITGVGSGENRMNLVLHINV